MTQVAEPKAAELTRNSLAEALHHVLRDFKSPATKALAEWLQKHIAHELDFEAEHSDSGGHSLLCSTCSDDLNEWECGLDPLDGESHEEAQARVRALTEAQATVRSLNGDGRNEPNDPALDAAEHAIAQLIDGRADAAIVKRALLDLDDLDRLAKALHAVRRMRPAGCGQPGESEADHLDYHRDEAESIVIALRTGAAA